MMVTILIVDDEPSIQFTFEQILLAYGYEVVGIACNGEEAVNLYNSFLDKPDIILMDHRMPVKNGLEATKEILEIDKHAKIIFTSADNRIKDEAISTGAVSFQSKPLEIQELIETIQKAVEFDT